MNMYDVVIIGMGMAGITAGIYAKRSGLKVLMLEKKAPGGILMQVGEIKNYPGYETISGPDLAMELYKQVKSLDIEFKIEEVINVTDASGIKKIITKTGSYEAKNVLIATGRTPKFLGIDNEKDYLGRGLSTCATCDGFLYKDEDVAVVGAGNSALSESLYLSNICKTVYIIHRGIEFKADDILVEKVKNTPNIHILMARNVKKINELEGKISSVTLDNDYELAVKGVFIYIGYRPDTDIFKDLGITNIEGSIIVNEDKMTQVDGIYAAGDCTKKDLYQLVTAASDGALAISNIDKK